MRVLYFGTYERDYARNAQVISCLRGAGVEVVEHHVAVWEDERHKFSPSLRTLGRAVRAQVGLARVSAEGADALIVGYPGHLDVPAAKRVAGERPVVFNPSCRSRTRSSAIASSSHPAPRKRGLCASWIAMRSVAPISSSPTPRRRPPTSGDRFGLAERRVDACYVGVEERVFGPGERTESGTDVVFVGKLIPLHGVDTILAAAGSLP